MKSLAVVFSALILPLFAACSHISLIPVPWNKHLSPAHINSSEIIAFLEAATNAAKDLTLADSVSDWQENCAKVAAMRSNIPEDTLSNIQQKECDSIVEQMQIGKLAIEMKRVEPKMGLKKCKLVSTEIMKHVNNLKNGGKA
jgi:hypothetical protein